MHFMFRPFFYWFTRGNGKQSLNLISAWFREPNNVLIMIMVRIMKRWNESQRWSACNSALDMLIKIIGMWWEFKYAFLLKLCGHTLLFFQSLIFAGPPTAKAFQQATHRSINMWLWLDSSISLPLYFCTPSERMHNYKRIQSSCVNFPAQVH